MKPSSLKVTDDTPDPLVMMSSTVSPYTVSSNMTLTSTVDGYWTKLSEVARMGDGETRSYSSDAKPSSFVFPKLSSSVSFGTLTNSVPEPERSTCKFQS